LFLCAPCIDELRDKLTSLPGWLEHLAEHALGLTRIGTASRRHRGDEQPMRYNPRASDLLDAVKNSLTTWIRHICEERGVEPEIAIAGPERNADGSELHLCGSHRVSMAAALWLAHNVHAIACDEAAVECFRDIDSAIKRIEKMIDRPQPTRIAGTCPTIIDQPPRPRHQCGMRLEAHEEQRFVTCRRCREEYDVERLRDKMLIATQDHTLPRDELRRVLRAIGTPLPKQTLHHWIHTGRLEPRGELDGQAMYRLGDVRKLMDERPRRKAG
jgi:hypothetical protein